MDLDLIKTKYDVVVDSQIEKGNYKGISIKKPSAKRMALKSLEINF